MTRVWPQRESGIALIAVLWVLVLLTVVASSLTFTQRAEIDLSRGLLQTAQARQLARGALHFALYMLQLCDADQSWRSDGEPHSLRFGDRDLQVVVYEEQGLIDLNRANPRLLGSALAATGADPEVLDALADAIADWVDADDVRHLHGAEREEYLDAGYSYGPLNVPFRDLSELRLVYGMSSDLYNALRSVLTVDSRRSQVNLMASPPQVRELIGDEMVAQFAGPAVPLGVQPMLPTRGAIDFGGGIRGSLLGGLRVHVEVPIPQGGRYVTEATVVLDNQARNGYRIVKWHEAGMNLTRSTNESGTAG